MRTKFAHTHTHTHTKLTCFDDCQASFRTFDGTKFRRKRTTVNSTFCSTKNRSEFGNTYLHVHCTRGLPNPFIHLFLFVCPSENVCLCVCLFVVVCLLCLLVHLSVSTSMSLSACLFAKSTDCFDLSICLSICLFILLSFYLRLTRIKSRKN